MYEYQFQLLVLVLVPNVLILSVLVCVCWGGLTEDYGCMLCVVRAVMEMALSIVLWKALGLEVIEAAAVLLLINNFHRFTHVLGSVTLSSRRIHMPCLPRSLSRFLVHGIHIGELGRFQFINLPRSGQIQKQRRLSNALFFNVFNIAIMIIRD